MIEIIRVAVAASLLLLASFYDVRSREVSDRLWVAFIALGLPLNIYVSSQTPDLLLLELASLVIGCGLGIGLFYLGLFGGADAKALICVSLTIPLFPEGFEPWGATNMFFPLSVLSNAALLSASTVIPILLRNLVWRLRSGRRLFEGDVGLWRKALVLLTGLKLSLSKVEGSINFLPMEFLSVSSDGRVCRKIRLFVPAYEDVDTASTKAVIESMAIPDEIWFTVSLPMLVFLTLGFFLALFLGDILTTLLRAVMLGR